MTGSGAREVIGPLLRGTGALVLTALLVVWLVDAALERVAIGGLPINLLLRGVEPFRGLSTFEALGVALGRSGALLLVALAIAALIGVGAGALYALSGLRLVRALSWAVGTAGIALPSFFWAMLLQFAVVTGYVVSGVRVLPLGDYGLDEHLVLPALALAARPAAYLFRTTATAFEDIRHGDYVRTARAKGLFESQVVRGHLLPNAAPAMLAGFGVAARSSLSSLAIVEYVFSWNGAGLGFIQAVAGRDIPFATVLAVAFALLFTLVGLVVALGTRPFVPRGAA